MNYETIKDWVIFKGLTGSRAYGTEIATSDFDHRGVFIYPQEMRLSLFDLPQESSDENEKDDKVYELKKFMELAMKATPNILELLWLPEDCIKICSPKFRSLILGNRKMFVTQKAISSHACYAFAQVKKAKGANKLINNPKPVEKPSRIDFCWFVPAGKARFDTIPLKETNIDISKCHATAIPHINNAYHLFEGGEGVWKGDMLVCENVPKEERENTLGMLVWQEDGYKRAVVEWKQYHEWMKVRNPARWEIQERGLDFDAKNMLHTIRLLYSAENIVKNGEPIVRFEGDTLAFLRKIREGVFSFEELMAVAEEKMAIVDSLKNSCGLPESVNSKKANEIFKELSS